MDEAVMNGHQSKNYAISKIWTEVRRTKFAIKQNFRQKKFFIGQNFQHRVKILSISSNKFFSDNKV